MLPGRVRTRDMKSALCLDSVYSETIRHRAYCTKLGKHPNYTISFFRNFLIKENNYSEISTGITAFVYVFVIGLKMING